MRTIQIVLSGLGLTAVLTQLEFNLLEANLYDFRMNQTLRLGPPPEIALITLDDQTTKALDDYAPLGLARHLELLKKLENLHPRAIGYLVNMNHVYQAEPESFSSKVGTSFVEKVLTMQKNGVPFLLGTPFDINGEILPPAPLDRLAHGVAIVHQDGNVFSEDKVTRRAITSIYRRPTFHLQLAQSARLLSPAFTPTGSQTIAEVDGEYFLFRYRAPGSFPEYSMIDVLEGRVSDAALAGKVLLIGTLSKENPSDFTKTPFSKKNFTHSKLYVHANILDSLLRDNGLSPTPTWVKWALTTTAVASVLGAVLYMTPSAGVLVSLGVVFLLLGVGQVLFEGVFGTRGWWIPLSHPLVGVILGFYLAVPYRLIREYKKRWDFQKRNEVLTQVEDLKRNFLNLVTHDLKTPIARIQGLAEVLLHGEKSAENKKNIQNIIESTEELNRFISSILELLKIQSNELRMRIESKDLNTLIERCVDSFRYKAQAKQIEIRCHLEPIFPISIDSNLISKVINNLIDNAINYSSTGGTIEIQSAEKNHGVEISVDDHGIGIAPEDLPNLFSRFYRGKNNLIQSVSGSGLGLYLTRFFVEAHGGSVEVTSTPAKGTRFTIWIPEKPPVSGLKTVLEKESQYVSHTRRG